MSDQYQARKSVTVERQTLTVGAVAALLAFLLGIAFSMGGKSSSIDQLSAQMTIMNNKLDTMTAKYTQSDKDTAVSIKGLEDEFLKLQAKVDDLSEQLAESQRNKR